MRKYLIMFFFLAIVLFANQIQVSIALQKTYDWSIPADSGYNTYQVSIITSDTWQVDATENIAFRLTLTSKSSVLDYTETNWVRITLSTENFIIDSPVQSEKVSLANIGDHWEKQISFSIPAEKLARGATLNTSITVVTSITEFDNIQHRGFEHTGQNYDNPMYIDINRPFLSTLELIVVVVVIIAVVGIGSFLVYRKMRKPETTN